MEELVDADLILGWLKERVENKEPIPPQLWLDAALKLNTLSSDETDKLIDYEYEVATIRAEMVAAGTSSAAAKAHVEGMPQYMKLRKQQEKLKQIVEAIRLAKLSARIRNDEMLRT